MSNVAASGSPGNGKGDWLALISGIEDRVAELLELASVIGEERNPGEVEDLSRGCEVLDALAALVDEARPAILRHPGSSSASIQNLTLALAGLANTARAARDAIQWYKRTLQREEQKLEIEQQPDTNLWRVHDVWLRDQRTLRTLREDCALQLHDLVGHVDGVLGQLRELT